MRYFSTRGHIEGLQASQCIIKGIAPDGGLFVPESIPRLNIAELGEVSYQELAARVFGLYLGDFSEEAINSCIASAYNAQNFDHPEIAPLVELNPGLYVQELWHGPTSAFKDMALQMLPRLMTASSAIQGEKDEIAILVATSGDTGKAALEGFRDVAGTRVVVFYPAEGVSQVQKMQMVTQGGANVNVAGVRGNFDDTQNGVKEIFADPEMQESLGRQGIKLSSANSINWGRLLPQIVYYLYSYSRLLAGGRIEAGEKVNIVVPTGNFGNILAAFYAKRMGMPVNKLICASNVNKVLTDFINTGVYDRRRRFEKTISPSMDILVSSNLERLLFELTGHNAEQTAAWMKELGDQGFYDLDMTTKLKVYAEFWGGFADDRLTLDTIAKVWKQWGYLMDPHTAVGMQVYEQYLESCGDSTPTILASTASPFKFSSDVARAVMDYSDVQDLDEFAVMEKLAVRCGLKVPGPLAGLGTLPVRHNTVIDRQQMKDCVISFLNG